MNNPTNFFKRNTAANESMAETSELLRISKSSSIAVNGTLILFCVLCILPLALIISISLSVENDIVKYGFKLIPEHLTFDAYIMIFKTPEIILNAYAVTIFVTVAGTILNLLITSMIAYPLSRRDFKYRKAISFFVFFTMLFQGGLVPYYLLMTRYLHVTDTLFALIIPNMFYAYYALLMRTNFQKIPISLIESMKIDGGSEFRVYAQIILPLSTPTIATVGLLVAIMIWNDWYSSLLFINDRKLYPLQMLLRTMLNNYEAINEMAKQQTFMQNVRFPTESLRMAMCLVAMGPILVLFPFLQKYFVKGLTVGSVKG